MKRRVFKIELDNNTIIYDPVMGIIHNTSTSNIIKLSRKSHDHFSDGHTISKNIVSESYKPFCLTIYISNNCNLSCDYCYIPNKHDFPQIHIDLTAVTAAAEWVAQNCTERRMPFILGFHGGNEPLLSPDIVNNCIEICRATARQHNLEFLSFCTTNGVISEKVAKWAARTFHGIRLSWDGSPDIHDKHRFKQNGKPSSANVESSAKIFLDPANELNELIIRTTITNDTVNKLPDIVRYFFKKRIRWIEVYPAFQNFDSSLNKSIPPNGTDFVKNFIIAKKYAQLHNIKLLFTGSRLMDFHDKHCLIYQNNLSITPDGHLTACFLASQNHHNSNEKFIYGHYDKKHDQIIIDWEKLSTIFSSISRQHPQCQDCFNYLHCSKGCPTFCPVRESTIDSTLLDCTVEKWIGLINIFEAAKLDISPYNTGPDLPDIKIESLQA